MGGYILSIVASCFIVALLQRFSDKFGVNHGIIRTLCGISMAITVAAPLFNLTPIKLSQFIKNTESLADQYVKAGTDAAAAQRNNVLIDRFESYILEKASLYGCDVSVQLRLTEESIPAPDRVCITGHFSPHAKNILSGILENDLGISREDQQWIYQN